MAPPSPPRQASSAPSSREPPAWSRELSALVRLATPLAAARIGFILLGVVDTAVVGRLGESALGAVGIANSIFYAIAMLGGGLVMGVDPVITQALGAEDEPLAARGFWQSLWLALALSLPMSLLAICAPVIFDPIGVDPQTAELATVYLWSRVPGLALMLVYTAFRTLFQAHGVTRPMVVGVIVANLVNLPLNILLVFGDQGLADAGLPTLGVPALGIVGAGITSSVATLLQLLVVVVALVQRLPEAARVRPPERQLLVKAARVGSPIGLQRLAEMGLFSVTGLAMARIGTRAVASHQVVMTLVTATFMVPLGVSAAAAVRVGRAIGAGDVRAARRSGFVAFGLAGAVMAVAASSMVLFPRTLAAIMTDQPAVLDAAVGLLAIGAWFQISDGLQVVAAGALRGLGDTQFILYANVAGHYLLGLPLGLVLGFSTTLGARGLWWGLVVGLTSVAMVLVIRFARRTLRPVERL